MVTTNKFEAESDKIEFAKRLTEAKADSPLRDLSQTQFGKMVGVSQSMVQLWLSAASKPRHTTILKIAEILRVSPVWLEYGLTGESEQYTAQEQAALHCRSHFPISYDKYTIKDVPVINRDCLVRVEGGQIDGYLRPLDFLCKEFDEVAKRHADYVIFRLKNTSENLICQQMSGKEGDLLFRLVNGKPIGHPSFCYNYSDGVVHCAIHSVYKDSSLWSE